MDKRVLDKKLELEGTFVNTLRNGKCEIIEYNSAKDVLVRFENGYERHCAMEKLLKGFVKNPYRDRVFGVGILDIPSNGANKPYYKAWCNMLKRCYYRGGEYHTYTDCTVDETWFKFSKFLSDLKDIRNSDKISEGWHLDKDLLYRNNKIYSKLTCCIVPTDVNCLVLDSANCGSSLPTGVSYLKDIGKYRAYLSCYNKQKYLGRYPDVESARAAYVTAKLAYVEEVLGKYADVIDQRFLVALRERYGKS